MNRAFRIGCVAACALLAGVAPPVRAQNMIDPQAPDSASIIQRIDSTFASDRKDTLDCEVTELAPRLNFAFRWHGGYRARFPVRQFGDEEGKLRVVFRVTPRSGEEPSYFWQDFRIPPGKRSARESGRVSGGFFLGQGSYGVDWMMMDEHNRSCREHWDTKLELSESDRERAQFVAPGRALPIVLEWEGTPAGPDRPYKIAVVLHLAPILPRSIRLTSFDRSLLATMLTSLLEETPFQEVSVSAVSLDKQDVVFRTGKLDPTSFDELLDTMGRLDLGTIDFAKYSNPNGPVEVLSDLVNSELASDETLDALVFIGPNTRHTLRFPKDRLERLGSGAPLFFYLNLDYYTRRYPWADTIERLTKGQGGKVFEIRNPKQLRKAIEKMVEMLAKARADHS